MKPVIIYVLISLLVVGVVLSVTLSVVLKRRQNVAEARVYAARSARQEAVLTQKWVADRNLAQDFESQYSRISADALYRAKQDMTQQSIVVCGLARNIAYCLPQTLTRLERLTEGFQTVHYVFFENDSHDATLRQLFKFQSRLGVDRVTVLHDTLNVEETKRAGEFLAATRFTAMANYRNRIVDHIRPTLQQYNFVLWHDLDALGGISRKGFLDTISMASTWDMVCAYGIDATVLRQKGIEHMYDTLAYRDKNGDRLDVATHVHWDIAGRRPWVKITSGFNGLAVYQAGIFATCEYKGGDCEHIALHDQMINKGKSRMFMNMNMKLLL